MKRSPVQDCSGTQLGRRTHRALCAMAILIPVLGGSLSVASASPAATDPREAAYWIGQELVSLAAGRSEKEAVPGSTMTVVTTLVEEPVPGDLNGDGVEDAAVWLLQQPGGTGSFLYVAVALNIEGRFVGTNAVFVGDRIVPQAMRIQNGILSVTYVDRHTGEPMAARPSVGVTKNLTVTGGVLAEVP
ncbi:MAG TPA: hypothetical protein VLS44_07085 [Nitrospira sp.]|nr:hypothetical protein [Nitrospira sp.]